MNLQNLLIEEVQHFIYAHENTDVRTLMLQQKSVAGVPTADLVVQISGRQKAREKLPLFYTTKKILYPPSLNLEQCSSEATAHFKKEILISLFSEQRPSLADVTGGFGIDSFFLSQCASALVHVEPDSQLQALARHNHAVLGASGIIYANTTAEQFLVSARFDVIYLDPSRRQGSNKVIALTDCMPDVITLQDSIFDRADYMMVKTSPLLDISNTVNALKFVKEVFVVSVGNECKELVILSKKHFHGEPTITAVDLLDNGSRNTSFTFTALGERTATVRFSDADDYLYEPTAAILKAGAFKSVAQKFDLGKLAPSTHLYTADHLVENFPGRIFRVVKELRSDPREIQEALPGGKANIITRNYPLTPADIKKKLKIKDGGHDYLLAFSGRQSKHLMLCLRIV